MAVESDQIVFEADPREEDVASLGDGIDAFNLPIVGPDDRESLSYFVRDEQGAIRGGLHGNTGRTWLYISALWVDESLRGKGLGSALMKRAEEEAIRRGCAQAYLNTFSYQAPDFYARLGYEVFAELDAFPDQHRRIFLRKVLARTGSA